METVKSRVLKHKILEIDKNRLILCGLLSEYPRKSKVVQRVLAKRGYLTPAQRMHIVATYFTPELPHSWVAYQFDQYGRSFDSAYKMFERVAYEQPGRDKYSWLGANNLQFIGHDEIERYYLRRDMNQRATHPSWVIPYFNDARKRGIKLRDIGDRLELNLAEVKYVVYRLCPKGMFNSNVRNPNPIGWVKQ